VQIEYELSTSDKPNTVPRQLIQFPDKMKGFGSAFDKATDNTYLHVIA